MKTTIHSNGKAKLIPENEIDRFVLTMMKSGKFVLEFDNTLDFIGSKPVEQPMVSNRRIDELQPINCSCEGCTQVGSLNE